MSTIDNILADPDLSRKFVELSFTADSERSKLAKVLDDPPELHNCILEIQADDGTWHRREPADWLLTVFLKGLHIGRVRYPSDYQPPRAG